MTTTYNKYQYNNNKDQTLSVSTQHSLVGYVGHVFCNDQQHLTRHASANQKIQKNLYQLIDQLKAQSPKTKHIKKVKIASWSKMQVQKFKQLLKVYGTDFQAISTVLGKTRDQVKRKYKVLQRKSDQVTQCVFNQRPISQKQFSEEVQFC